MTLARLARLRAVSGWLGPSWVSVFGHHVTNIILTEVARWPGGQVARVRSKGIGIQADGSSGSVVYDDLRTAAGWRTPTARYPRAARRSAIRWAAAQRERVAVLREGLSDARPHRRFLAVRPMERHAEMADPFRNAGGCPPREPAGLEGGRGEQVPGEVGRDGTSVFLIHGSVPYAPGLFDPAFLRVAEFAGVA